MKTVVAARTLRSVVPIDGGDRLVVEVEDAEGETLLLSLPTQKIANLNDMLGFALIKAAAMQAAREGNSD